MTFDHAYRALLEKLVEDDLRLWDIHRELNATLPSDASDDNLVRAKQFVVRGLIDGIFTAYYASWDSANQTTIVKDKAISLVSNASKWIPPELDQPFITITCTLRGEEHAKSGQFELNLINSIMKLV